MKQTGTISVFTGPMFSGKSKALMARLETKQRAHKKVLVVKPLLDNRFGSIKKIVSKRKKTDKFEADDSMSAYPIRNEAELLDLVNKENPDVLGVDEAQFFDLWLGPVLFQLHNNGLEIYVAGLDLDAWAEPFGPMPNILTYADSVQKFTANCFQCGQDARLTQKIGGSSSEQVQVGAEEIYEARCENCWTHPL